MGEKKLNHVSVKLTFVIRTGQYCLQLPEIFLRYLLTVPFWNLDSAFKVSKFATMMWIFPAPLVLLTSLQYHIMLDHYYKTYLFKQKERKKDSSRHNQEKMILCLFLNEGKCHHRSDYTCITYVFFFLFSLNQVWLSGETKKKKVDNWKLLDYLGLECFQYY